MHPTLIESKPAMKAMALAGRVLFAQMFVVTAPSLFDPITAVDAAEKGVPLASFLVPVAGAISILGGLSVAFGYYARIGGWLLVVFLVPVTWKMHSFWGEPHPESLQQMVMFMKNIALLGGALMVTYFGGGPWSIDRLLLNPVRPERGPTSVRVNSSRRSPASSAAEGRTRS
jgi:putative oxidoreductase